MHTDRTDKTNSSKGSDDPKKKSKEMLTRYSLPTKMGNWMEDKALMDEKIDLFNVKLERCEIFLQRKNLVIEYLNFKVDIANYNDNLLYNAPVQIISEHEDVFMENRVLSTIVTEKQIEERRLLELSNGCIVTVSKDDARKRRNVFIVMSTDPGKVNTPVLFGDEIYIKLHSANSKTLYVQSDIPGIDTFGNNHNPVVLSETMSRYNKFKIVHPDTAHNCSLIGTPVPANARVCINHILSNKLLACESATIATLFGTDEHLASCFTYKDMKSITSENFWIFVTKTIGEGVAE